MLELKTKWYWGRIVVSFALTMGFAVLWARFLAAALEPGILLAVLILTCSFAIGWFGHKVAGRVMGPLYEFYWKEREK